MVIERGRYTSFSACGIPYLVGGLVTSVDALVARSPEEHRLRGLDVRMRHEVTAIDTSASTVTVRDLDAGTDQVVPYDQLVVATGATPVRPPIPGIDAEGVYGVQTLEDGIAVRHEVEVHEPKRAVVVGAGYIGIEMAEALLTRGVAVTCLAAGATPMETFDPDMGEMVAEAIRGLGIDLHLGESVLGFDVADGRVRAVETRRGTYPADLVVLGIGSRPGVELARRAGITIGPTGGIATDDRQRTSARGVFAAGDCVETHHRLTGAPVAIALGTHANKQGRVVGVNATGGDIVFPGVIGTAVSKVCAYEIARTGSVRARGARRGVQGVPDRHRLDQPRAVLPGRGAGAREARHRDGHRSPARRTDRGRGGGSQADRRPRHVHLERDDRGGGRLPRPRLRPAVLAGLGPGPRCRARRRCRHRGVTGADATRREGV